MIEAILRKFWAFGLCVALLVALSLTLLFTVWNWLENPGNIFRDTAGTNWEFVYATAASWFAPTFLYTFIVASGVHCVTLRLLSLYANRGHGK